MDQTLKSRLVGAMVLLGLAVIILPLLLDGANEQALLAETRMPPAPVVPEAAALLVEPAAQLPEVEAGIVRDHAPAEPEPAAPRVIPPVAIAPAAVGGGRAPERVAPAAAAVLPPAADPRLQALAEGWDVQVAAVLAISNAERLQAKLLAAGYPVRVLKVGKLHRVLVGPELRREDVERLRDRLAADVRVGKLKGVLVRYVP